MACEHEGEPDRTINRLLVNSVPPHFFLDTAEVAVPYLRGDSMYETRNNIQQAQQARGEAINNVNDFRD
jgi:hypothetical protein